MSKRKGRSREFIDDSDDPEDTGVKTKKAKMKETRKEASASSDGEMIPLSAKRFINVRTFNGKILVDIREYYEDDSGERKPGRKGISLSLDQWEKLKDVIPEVDSKIDAQS